MKKALVLATLLAVSGSIYAQQHQHAVTTAQATGMHIGQAWSRMSAPNAPGAVFVDVSNFTGQDDILIKASSPISNKIELHTHINDKGVMRMREVKGGIPLPNKANTSLQPGGYHIMLMSLDKPLQVGQTFPITLTFKKAPAKTVTVTVNNGQGQTMNHGDHNMHH